MQRLKRLLKALKRRLGDSLRTSWYTYFFYHAKLGQNALFESRNGLDLAGNIFYLLKEMTEGQYDVRHIYLSVADVVRPKAEKMLELYGVKNVKLVKQGSLKYFKLLASTKYIFTDTSLPRAYIKKDGQIFTNTWHGTPLKKMGKFNLSERYSMGNVQRALLFSDYLIFPNDFMRETMLKSYNIDTLYGGTVLCEGYPRNSVFFEKERAEQMRKTLKLESKRAYVYMPTWKVENMGKTLTASLKKLNDNLKEIDELLGENEVFFLKLHPLVSANADTKGFKHIKPFPTEYESYDVLNACDVLVTDYSSVFFDFAASGKKIVLYTPDETDYASERGFNFPLSQLPFSKTQNANELVDELRLEKSYDDTEFVKRFCTYDRKNASKFILEKIMLKKDSCKTFEIVKSNKKKTLFYCGALLQNGLTAAFKNLLSQIDLEKREYYFTYKQSAFKNHPERLDAVGENIRLFGISSNLSPTLFEAFCFALYYKLDVKNKAVMHYVKRALKRDFKKHFTGFDMDYVINFSGYDKYIIALLSNFKCKRTIFVHSDMQKEISLRRNQHKPTLAAAYKEYDNVAVVTNAMISPTVKISGSDRNILTVGNCFDYDGITQKAKKQIEFDKDTRSSINYPAGIEGILKQEGTKFVSVGRFSAEKQHFMLIDAFEEYNIQNPESYLIIIGGGGDMYQKTVRYANSKQCSKNIAIIYSLSNPFPIVKRCDLFILSSKYEALGLVLLEADALSLPSICTQMKGPAEILKRYGGNMVENSKEGILEGMYDFKNGKLKPMNIDFKEYNKETIMQFEKLFN